MKLPAGRHFPGCPYSPLLCYLVGNKIFSLRTWLMKPFPGKLTEEQSVYKYRHSRPRLVIKKSFGILRAQWRNSSNPIKANVENLENHVWSAICLHNYLRLTKNATFTPAGFVESRSSLGDIRVDDWRKICLADNSVFQVTKKIRGSRHIKSSNDMRNGLKDYVQYIKRNAPFVQKVTFEPLIDLKQNHYKS